jgi:MFS family permease
VLASIGTELYSGAVLWIGLVDRDAGYVATLQTAAVLVGGLLTGTLTDRWRHTATQIWIVRRGMLAGYLLAPLLLFWLPLSSMIQTLGATSVLAGLAGLAVSRSARARSVLLRHEPRDR